MLTIALTDIRLWLQYAYLFYAVVLILPRGRVRGRGWYGRNVG